VSEGFRGEPSYAVKAVSTGKKRIRRLAQHGLIQLTAVRNIGRVARDNIKAAFHLRKEIALQEFYILSQLCGVFCRQTERGGINVAGRDGQFAQF